MGKGKYGIELSTVDKLSKNIQSLRKENLEICIVIGGGNIFRGLAASAKGMDRANADYMGMLGTVINSLALQSNLKKLDVESRVMTAISINRVAEPYIKNKATNHLDKKRVVIFASGTGNPFFSTDTAASLRAAELKCTYIYKATQVDGIYSKDQKKSKDAKKFKT